MIDRQLPTTRVVIALLYGFDGYFSDGYYGSTAWKVLGRTHGCTDQCCIREESSCQLGVVHTCGGFSDARERRLRRVSKDEGVQLMVRDGAPDSTRALPMRLLTMKLQFCD
jgi:hypothetical protein